MFYFNQLWKQPQWQYVCMDCLSTWKKLYPVEEFINSCEYCGGTYIFYFEPPVC